MLLKVGLLSFQSCDLILHFVVFIFLGKVRVPHILVSFKNIVGQSFSNLLRLSCEGIVEFLLLGSQSLDLLLIEVQLFLSCFDRLLKTIDLSLKSGSVDCGLLGSSGLSVDDSNVGVYGVTADGGHILNDLF